MNITGATSNYYNYFNNQALQGKVSTSTATTNTETEQIGKKPPQGPPPNGMPPQGEPPELNLDQDGDEAWSVDELTSFAEFSKSEFGTELDVEALMTEYDADEDGTLTKSEIKSLMDNNGLKLPEKPPKLNDVDEQMQMMQQMQASSSSLAQSLINSTASSSSNTSTTASSLTSNVSSIVNDSASSILDYISENDDETSYASSVTADSETIREKIEQQLLDAYANMSNEEDDTNVSFVA